MLLRLLSSSLGRSQASRELRWMQQACDSGASTVPLELMVRRRLTGEPLQYILGLQHFPLTPCLSQYFSRYPAFWPA
ncbi:hypothetical protein CPB84DRAFT_1773110 [Gymnopilus junonius]|uniref:Release factor glutamine methyltransferase N-terminal domain-containing protein n=1 Tax=Gymnopilus junonius TaxID=109634 RepID=A0A9P5NTZ6_GYMJU|nr:hypothetical protein CPB84DRAFT_1773110 [Gymnopilus junonius]